MHELVETARVNYQEAMARSIENAKYVSNEEEFIDAETRLATAIASKHLEPAKHALMDLRSLYNEHGAPPTPTDSGKYIIMHFLEDIRECIDIVSDTDAGWK